MVKSNNKSGYLGVRWHHGKWEASTYSWKKQKILGRFSNIEDASNAYQEYIKNKPKTIYKTPIKYGYVTECAIKSRQKYEKMRNENPEQYNLIMENQRKRNLQNKILVMEKYGNKCSCCGEHNLGFLTIEHINGSGRKHRKEIGCSSSGSFYRWLLKHDCPKDNFTILCYNCNCGKGVGDICPHHKIYPITNKTQFKEKLLMIDGYGGKCECCGETNYRFLTIDHIFNDGTKECNEMGLMRGYQFYKWLRQNNYPKDRYRLLCYNCNSGRKFGQCPHKKEVEIAN